MKVALFGGSFNPPHIGHQLVCLYLLEYKGFDKVYLIPTYKHPFGKDLTDFEHRWTMCTLLTTPFGRRVLTIDVESIERHKEKSYTIDTVKYYTKHYPDDDFTLIIGSDILNELDKWKDIDEIKKLVAIEAYPRVNHPINNLLVSSTKIRELIGKGVSIAKLELVPESIREYIEKTGLYKNT